MKGPTIEISDTFFSILINGDSYIDELYDNDPEACEKITHCSIKYIDRGVQFVEFANYIHERFPNLQFLAWSQNYSCCLKEDQSVFDEFIRFIIILQLKHLGLKDYQTKCFDDFKLDGLANPRIAEIFRAMPENSTYTIEHAICTDTHYIGDKAIMHDVKSSERTLIYGTKTLILNICNCDL